MSQSQTSPDPKSPANYWFFYFLLALLWLQKQLYHVLGMVNELVDQHPFWDQRFSSTIMKLVQKEKLTEVPWVRDYGCGCQHHRKHWCLICLSWWPSGSQLPGPQWLCSGDRIGGTGNTWASPNRCDICVLTNILLVKSKSFSQQVASQQVAEWDFTFVLSIKRKSWFLKTGREKKWPGINQ